jgi:hypothetical protein
MKIERRNEDGAGGRMLFSCALPVRAGACFVFGFNGHLLAWVADAIVASRPSSAKVLAETRD